MERYLHQCYLKQRHFKAVHLKTFKIFLPHFWVLWYLNLTSVTTDYSTWAATSPVFTSAEITEAAQSTMAPEDHWEFFGSWQWPHPMDNTWARDQTSWHRFSSQTIYSHFMESQFLSYCAKSMAHITELQAICSVSWTPRACLGIGCNGIKFKSLLQLTVKHKEENHYRY